jgi:hypothetical protein
MKESHSLKIFEEEHEEGVSLHGLLRTIQSTELFRQGSGVLMHEPPFQRLRISDSVALSTLLTY